MRNWKASLLGLLLQHLLLILETEELLAILEKRLKEGFILRVLDEGIELLGNVALLIVRLARHLPHHGGCFTHAITSTKKAVHNFEFAPKDLNAGALLTDGVMQVERRLELLCRLVLCVTTHERSTTIVSKDAARARDFTW